MRRLRVQDSMNSVKDKKLWGSKLFSPFCCVECLWFCLAFRGLLCRGNVSLTAMCCSSFRAGLCLRVVKCRARMKLKVATLMYVYIYICIMWFKLYVIFTSHNWEWLIPEIYGDWGDWDRGVLIPAPKIGYITVYKQHLVNGYIWLYIAIQCWAPRQVMLLPPWSAKARKFGAKGLGMEFLRLKNLSQSNWMGRNSVFEFLAMENNQNQRKNVVPPCGLSKIDHAVTNWLNPEWLTMSKSWLCKPIINAIYEIWCVHMWLVLTIRIWR